MNSTPDAPTESPDYEDIFSYEYGNKSLTCSDVKCIFMVVALVIISTLGVTGNGLVIWITGFRMKKSVFSTWCLSLAMSDFLFCSFLPFVIVYIVKNDWIFGFFMCKISSFIVFLHMNSSIFLLTIFSVDYVVLMFPVWTQDERSVKKASVIVSFAWIFSAVLSWPAITFQEFEYNRYSQTNMCFYKYTEYQGLIVVVVSRFFFGFVIPFLVIGICYAFIIRKLNTNQIKRSKKTLKIMTALIVTFFICWLPYHMFALMELSDESYYSIVYIALVYAITLAFANSCMNPLLYVFMGKAFEKNHSRLLSKIQNAIEEDDQAKT